MNAKLTRGERNNNPLNIVRSGIAWKGLSKVQGDARFCQFDSMQFGWRAALVLLRNYIKGRTSSKRQLDTIEKIIERWAPSCENNTQMYIKSVSEEVGIDRRTRIRWEDRVTMCAIVKAMAKVECGKVFPVDPIYSAYDMIS